MVRRLSKSVAVKAPSSFAAAFMSTHFLERGLQTSGAELALRFPLPRFIVDGLTLEKRVIVHLKYATSGASGQALAIGWDRSANGSLPGFDGALTAIPETESTCRLAISGSYAPPGGVPGAIFDALIGARIANATIAALLQEFRESIETDFAIRSIP